MISVRFLFWNMHGVPATAALKALASDHRIDILVLAESSMSPVSILAQLNAPPEARYHLPLNLSARLTFIAALPPDRVVPVYDGAGVTIRRVFLPVALDLLVVALHLPSKRHFSDADHALLSTRISRMICEAEDRAGHNRTVVIGDFNMDPFEVGVVGSEGFHAVMARSIAARESRTVQGEVRRFFYNPMWSLLGDHSGPPGTYYYPSSAPVTYFWHMFDQVLLRPVLARAFAPGDIVVVDSIGGTNLFTATGRPKAGFSDHLPIVATIRLEEQIG